MKKSRLIKKSTLKLATNYIATPSLSHNGVAWSRYKTFAKSSQRTKKHKSLISEINTYKHTINKRLKIIKQNYKLPASTAKISSEMKKYKSKNISNLNLRKLTILRNRLKYANNLKSTTKQGVITALKREANYKKKIDKLVNELQANRIEQGQITRGDNHEVIDMAHDILEKVTELYNKLIEENGIMEKFKYEIMDDIKTLILTGLTDDEILSMMESKLKYEYEEYQEQGLNFEWTYF